MHFSGYFAVVENAFVKMQRLNETLTIKCVWMRESDSCCITLLTILKTQTKLNDCKNLAILNLTTIFEFRKYFPKKSSGTQQRARSFIVWNELFFIKSITLAWLWIEDQIQEVWCSTWINTFRFTNLVFNTKYGLCNLYSIVGWV